LAARIQKALKEKNFTVSLSIGIAPYIEGDTLDGAVKRADRALYTSKEQGRDRVTLYSEVSQKL
jgi:GGDEF domain-containing protein